MNRRACVCLLVGIGCLGATIAGAERSPRLEVTVRVYNTLAVAGHQLRTAERTAGAVFDDAGITVRWRRCAWPQRPPIRPNDRCGAVLEPTELVVRLVIAPTDVDPSVLGYSLVDGLTRTGTLSTIFADHLERLAARVRLNRGTLLGLTMAHEIGHLLLGTNLHATEGLMRARWTDETLRHRVTQEWQFSSAEISQLLSAVGARTTAAIAAPMLAPR